MSEWIAVIGRIYPAGRKWKDGEQRKMVCIEPLGMVYGVQPEFKVSQASEAGKKTEATSQSKAHKDMGKQKRA